ncbi:hypothetical protein K438DRAFT_1954192 [Mycena galopus ATCC 62051]|nr:hypothetical protein K438DRAFT_1954192 [Mycena galopus ATCC 62051]
MANIAARAGSMMIRVGGTSQESTQLAPDVTIPDGRVIIKNLTGVTSTTRTPPLEFSSGLLSSPPRMLNGTPVRVAIMSYLDDPTGASDVFAVISISGEFTMPASVPVKYLAASSVTQKGNYTPWGHSSSLTDARWGRKSGSTATQQPRPVPSAPGFALVFLNSDAAARDTARTSSMTFSTTALTKTKNTVTVNPSALVTSNGMMLSEHDLAGTSEAPSAAPARRRFRSSSLAS